MDQQREGEMISDIYNGRNDCGNGDNFKQEEASLTVEGTDSP
jgi:hypothetical protein